jgi:hypothetical protein
MSVSEALFRTGEGDLLLIGSLLLPLPLTVLRAFLVITGPCILEQLIPFYLVPVCRQCLGAMFARGVRLAFVGL